MCVHIHVYMWVNELNVVLLGSQWGIIPEEMILIRFGSGCLLCNAVWPKAKPARGLEKERAGRHTETSLEQSRVHRHLGWFCCDWPVRRLLPPVACIRLDLRIHLSVKDRVLLDDSLVWIPDATVEGE